VQISSNSGIVFLPRQSGSQEYLTRPGNRLAEGSLYEGAEHGTRFDGQPQLSGGYFDRELTPQNRPQAINRSDSNQFDRLKAFSELPPEGRRALTAYTETQRSSVVPPESILAGIDIFV